MGPVTREVWESLGQTDADWAVLTERKRRHGGWSEDLAAFYASGQADVDAVLALVDPLPVRALDWGCGTGRLSLALAGRGIEVTSVDVAESMLATLAARAAERGLPVHPVLVDEFQPTGDYDLALSLLVLQHLPDVTSVQRALQTMVAALRPGGTIVVEIPSQPLLWRARLQPRFRAYRALRRLGVPARVLQARGLSGISMLAIPVVDVRLMLGLAGATGIEVAEHADPDYVYARYAGRRG
ncbi:MAG: hypothetical protein NVSMB13_10960 [Mycobacteriales bacterium]